MQEYIGRKKTVVFFATASLLLALALLFVYWQPITVAKFFYLDSDNSITKNSDVKITSLDLKSLNQAFNAGNDASGFRPFAMLTFGIDYYFHGLDGRGFRATNLAILILCGLSVMFFTYLLCLRWTSASGALAIGLATGVLWALHPLQTNITAYIAQRVTSFAILGYMMAMGFFILGEMKGKRYWILAALFAAFGVMNKELVMYLPFAIALYRIAWDERAHNWAVGRKWPLLVGGALPFVGVGVASWTHHKLYFDFAWEFTPWQRLITEARVLWDYVGLMLLPLPSRLNLDHDYTFSSDLLTPLTTLPAILMHAAVVALAFWLWRRHRLSALLIFLYYLSHLIESTTLGLDLMFEHRMSLPMVFLMILFCFWLWRGMVILFGENRRAVCAFSAIVVFLSLGLGGLTATRLQAWESQRIFIEDMYRKAPNNARVVFSLGREYWLEGNYAEGEKYFVRAMQLDPYDWKAPTNLAVVYSDQKRCKEAVEIVDHLMTMFTAQPAHYRVLGMCAEQYEQFDKSIQYHKKSLELMPDMPETRLFIARNYQKQGMLDVARRYAMEELKFYPDDEVALRFLDFLDEKEREVQ